ncbi:carbohydrate ABC transporter permease [Halomonas nitroreducens]|uniref:Carbohydrate ABC transporter permease n=1 Tax=Halomonas nitroreducens TaxID=447425 RepID=A0A3S0HM24_9GAMM|nr:carbohydrate ABC transporter permease [Halomonas nitroreducens]RTQ97676.1 carbohydrate ABC transporter permease [Halomonas nitroreducens]
MTTARTKPLSSAEPGQLAQGSSWLGALRNRRLWLGVLGWTVACLIFFPIFWMVLTGFKTEAAAVADPSLIFSPTLDSYAEVQNRANYLHFALNSVVVAFGSTLLALLIAIPSAYSMAFLPTKRTKGTLLWMLSTKMLPPVGVLVPIYLLFRDTGLLDTRTGLIIVYTLMNLPIVVWMLYTFFKDMPKDILEAGRMDGASTLQEVLYLLLPLTLPGIASTGLLAVILSWNEAFWSLNLTSSQAAPLTAYIASFSSPEGLFWAKLSAASTMAIAPILVFGWLTQKQMVRGLTFGAVK